MTCWRVILITVVLMTTRNFYAMKVWISGNNLKGYDNDTLFSGKRLPTDVVPRKYIIAISTDFLKNEFHGCIRIEIEILEVRSYIVLHSKDLTIKSAKLYSSKSESQIPIKLILYLEEPEMIVIEASKILMPGWYFLKMSFNGSLEGKINGFYLSSYMDIDGTTRKLAVTQFEPFYARTAFPCFDEPSFKSVFLIRLVYTEKQRYHALSNMPIAKTERMKNKNDTRITFFEASPLMSTYLVAFIVTDFECLSSSMSLLKGTEIPLNICVRPMYRNKAKFALNVASRLMQYYSKTLNSDYPLPKLDLVAIPDFAAGAMENWGLITFRETEVLYNEEHSSHANAKSVGLTVAHELAHMWFGNLVTMKWWDDLWLNEGFASYMEHKAVDFILPEWKQMELFASSTKYVSMKRDRKLSVRPIIKYSENLEEIDEMFDRISYQKAAAVIRMLEDALGNSNFLYYIRNYLQTYQFRNTESSELFEILRNSTRGIDIAEFIGRWMKFPGFPVVNVRRDNTIFELSQQRFPANGKPRETLRESWDIPVKYVTNRREDGVKFVWFLANYSCAELPMNERVDWIKLNHNSVGYYIVNYSEEDWKNFGNLLSQDFQALNPIDRADLLHDAFLLADSADLCFCIAMNLTSYLVNETAYQPWLVAAEWLVQTNRLLDTTNVHIRFQTYARSLVEVIYRKVGWEVGKLESLVDRELRVLILNAACSIGHKHCLEVTGRKLKNLLKRKDTQTLPADIRSIVYSFGLVTQPDDVGSIFENMSQLETRENDVQEKARLMIGLTSVQDKNILARYLERASDERFVRKQDFCEILIRIAGNSMGLDGAWNFIRSNFDILFKKYSSHDYTLGKALVAIMSLFKDERKLEEVREFFSQHENIGISENAKENAIEEIQRNIDWLKENVEKIDRWLRINGYD